MQMQKAVDTNVSHTEAALARIEEIHAMRKQIPDLDIPVPQKTRKALGPAGTVPPEFIEAATNSRSVTPELLHGAAVAPEKLRDLMSFATAYEPVADQLESLARFIRQKAAEAKNVAGSEALVTYSLAQRLATRPATTHLSTEVDTMRAALGRRFRRKSKTEPVPPPVNTAQK